MGKHRQVLCLPGVMVSSKGTFHDIEYLLDRMGSVTYIDYPLHGFTWDTFAAQLKDMIHTSDEVVLVGSSFGAWIWHRLYGELSAADRKRVRQLIYFGSFDSAERLSPHLLISIMQQFLRRGWLLPLAVCLYLTRGVFLGDPHASDVREVRSSLSIVSTRTLIRRIEALLTYQSENIVCDVPAVLCWWKWDIVNSTEQKDISVLFPKGRTVMLTTGRHGWISSSRKEIEQHLKDILFATLS